MKYFVGMAFFLIIVAAIFFRLKQDSVLQFPKMISGKNLIQTTPTPIPFTDMTIPYLRNRTYIGKLGDLEKVDQNDYYTSYLTSYDSDGLKVYGLLTIPVTEKTTYPAVVFVHGYIPPAEYRTLEKYVDYVDYLARNGFVVFKTDLRGHGNSEGEAGGAYYSSDYVTDTLNAYAALQNTDFVDPDKIGLWGHSMAGNVVLRSLAARPEIPAVVIWVGAGYTYTDFLTYRISDRSYQMPTQTTPRQRRRLLLRETYGEFDPNHEFWRQVPATNYLGDIKGAVQIHHAADDTVVSIGYTQNLKSLLDATKVVHEIYEYPIGSPNLTGTSFSLAMERSVDFFQTHLQ